MAKPVSDEELQLKKRARRRLIGAIVLVTTVAVVLPMVLDREPKQVSQDINIRIPSTETSTFSSKVAPQPPSDAKPAAVAPAADAVVPGAKPAVAAGSKAVSAEEEAAKAAIKTEAAKAPVKAPVSKDVVRKASPAHREEPVKKAASAPAGTFVVQVVALSDAAKAQQMQQRISSAGIKAYTEIIKTAKGDVTRVRVGPFSSHNAAEKAQQQLKAIGLDGKVIPK